MYVHKQPRQSKRSMLAQLHEQPAQARLAARNTLDYTLPNGDRVIRLHQTDILTIYDPGSRGLLLSRFRIFTNGWNTVTTRARLNEFLPAGFQVYTRKGVMCLNGTPFRQEVEVMMNGTIRSDIAAGDETVLAKKIDAYMREWRKKGLPTVEESGGDPWVISQPKVSHGVMLDWIESKYVFRLMYGLALEYAGVPDTGIGYYHHWADQRDGKLERIDYSRIRRYIRACLGLAA